MQTSLLPIAVLSALAAAAGRSAEAPLTALPPQPAESRPLAERSAEPPAST
ncbi:MAG: hypothetical protein GX748_06960, partial [Lentisphaerae bacterium]|nr:hypothetical protein [Lentisphaerota bacterium]